MMTQVDIGLLAFIVISGLLSFRKGLVRQVGTLIVLMLAILAAMILGPKLQQYFNLFTHQSVVQLVAAYVVTFFSIMIIGHLLVSAIEGILSSAGLSGTDRLLGVGFGMLRSVLLISGVLYGLKLTPLAQSDWWQQSTLIPQFGLFSAWVEQWLPHVSESLETVSSTLHGVADELPNKTP